MTFFALRREFAVDLKRQIELANDPSLDQPVRRWWFDDGEGAVTLSLYFRGKRLDVNGPGDTAVLPSIDDVREVLNAMRVLVDMGSLDRMLLSAVQK
ncbi:hypothetical protein [Caulobacter sp. RL271]|uniref:Uncharacterized protein n=1 Tax=Caulobacter segnis TaxID=88688 RepID=A0ABY4ZVC4_9CAUL|nr:hypothetical protein [Caulobacter segnis]USQ95886.1 hypothetical protein MZV50_25680 [Caulobacter segnis]